MATRQAAARDRRGGATLHAPAGLGPSLRRAWLGYQRRLDEEMGAAGFDDRAFPNGRVLRFCTGADHTTIADVGRHLGVSRQRAAQIVTNLRQRGYVTVSPSTSSGKEKTVDVTPRAIEYLAAHRRAAAKIEQSLVATLGPEGLSSLHRLVTELAGDEDLRLRDYLRQKRQDGGLRYPEE